MSSRDPKADNLLINAIRTHFKCKHDKDLAAKIGLTPSQLSNYRHGKYRLTPSLILTIHEATGWPTSVIREIHNQQLIINSKTNRGEK